MTAYVWIEIIAIVVIGAFSDLLTYIMYIAIICMPKVLGLYTGCTYEIED